MTVLAELRCTACRSDALRRPARAGADLTRGWVCAKCGAPAKPFTRVELPPAPERRPRPAAKSRAVRR